MGDLVAAAKKQYEYAKNEYLSGDEKKGDQHRAKAEAFIDRIAAGEGAPVVATPDDEPEAPPADEESLSDDPSVARGELLARVGLDETASGAAIIGASTSSEIRLFTILGPLGQPGTFPDADYSLFKRFYEPTSPPAEGSGLQSWAPKAEYATANIWKLAKEAEGV